MIQGFLSFLFSFFFIQSYRWSSAYLHTAPPLSTIPRPRLSFFPSVFRVRLSLLILLYRSSPRCKTAGYSVLYVHSFVGIMPPCVRARVCVGWSGYSPHYAHSRTRIRSIHTHAIANRTERRAAQMLRRVRVLRQDFL